MRDSGNIRVYPEYFDSSLTRAQGRRVSKKVALENPSLGELRISAQKLHYTVEVEKEKAYSRHWDNPKGLLYLSKEGTELEKVPKTKVLRDLSKTVKEFARPYLAQKMKEERAKQEALAGKKGKQQGKPQSQRPGDKKQAGKPMRRRR